jgi:hypothetical protein
MARRNFKAGGRFGQAKKKGASCAVPVDDSLDLSSSEYDKGVQAYDDWHWGNCAHKVVDWNDSDFPRMLIECGRLIRLHVRVPDSVTGVRRHPRRRRDAMIEFARNVSSNSHVAYDPDHRHERLYLLVDSRASQALKQRFWDDNPMDPQPLQYWASLAGGRHGRSRDYPDILVKPVGVLTDIVYKTDKQGDGLSFYIHKMGELTHHLPILCVDERGRLWLAGGNYTCPTPGITD